MHDSPALIVHTLEHASLLILLGNLQKPGIEVEQAVTEVVICHDVLFPQDVRQWKHSVNILPRLMLRYLIFNQSLNHLSNVDWLGKHSKLAVPAEFIDNVPEK